MKDKEDTLKSSQASMLITESQTIGHYDKIVLLRKKLKSVVWVQCDNYMCAKWRKLPKQLAHLIKKETHWTCNMNNDPIFNSCDVPEEDTFSYDKLAKKAKLDLIKSEIKPGSLVWAKMTGYKRWPAIITADPLSGLHCEKNGKKISWYHVEFLGDCRSHAWITASNVDVFHLGDIHDVSLQVDTMQTKKKKKCRLSTFSKKNHRTTCNYTNKLKAAIIETLGLVTVSCEERLQTCWFVTEDDLHLVKGPLKFKNKNVESLQSSFKSRVIQKSSAVVKGNFQNYTEPKKKQEKGCQKLKNSKAQRNKRSFPENMKQSRLNLPSFLVFQTSLLNVSREERFILDLQTYVKNEKAFKLDVARFIKSRNLKLATNPVWQNIEMSQYDLFIAVYEQGGYTNVCERRQWSNVFTQVTNVSCSRGGSRVKNFYKKSLYSYEQYVNSLNYGDKSKEQRMTCCDNLINDADLNQVNDGHLSVCRTSNKQENDFDSPGHQQEYDNFNSSCLDQGDDDFDSPEVIKELKELDAVLVTLCNNENFEREERVVPVLGYHPQISPIFNAMTASYFGDAAEPDEKTQVVPELDFPSSMESSQLENELVYYDMQALHHDMDYLQEVL